MKIEFSSQRREMLLFLTTNMAAVTSRANQQFMLEGFGRDRDLHSSSFGCVTLMQTLRET